MRLPPHWFRCHAANDISKDALAVLTDDSCSSDHVFTGLLECLPEAQRRRIESMRPPRGAKKAVAAASYRAQKTYMVACKEELFHRDACAGNCLKHKGSFCPLFWGREEEAGSEQLPRPVTMNFSGTMCTPWTSQGPQLGDADPAMESWNFWILKMRESQLDLIFMENSDRFPFGDFASELSPAGYDCYFAIFSPEDPASVAACVVCELGAWVVSNNQHS